MTAKQETVLDAIRDFQALNGFAPTYRELQRILGFRSVSQVYWQLEALRAQGKLTYRRGLSRTMRLL